MKGIVVKSTGSWYEVLDDDDKRYNCRIKGKLRLSDIKTTNPVAVGDYVEFDPAEEVISSIEPRSNYIIRKSVKKSKEAHIIASNVDQALLVATITYPRTSIGFIDRFLISAEAFRIPQIIVFNKQDILEQEHLDFQQMLIDGYSSIGVKCLKISATEDHEFKDLEELLRDKITVIGGHSGVGKSTLLNRIDPELDQKTAEISDFASKGVHTTTFAEMFTLPNGARVVDTPGIKELGLLDMDPVEISDYFPEMRDIRLDCRFSNCLHITEPGCAVKEAVENGEVTVFRYESYVSMILDEDNRR